MTAPLTWGQWLKRRAVNYRVFALDWTDPVEASTYAGYGGA